MNLNNNCLNCSVIPKICTSFQCTQSTQIKCPDVLKCNQSLIWEHCYTCESMKSNSRCLTCDTGHKSNGDGGCVACGSDECCPENITSPVTSHCEKCDDDGSGCGECSKGYYINDADGSCQQCEKSKCCPGYTHFQGASGCHECTSDQVSCASCPENTTLKSGAGGVVTCEACSSGQCCGEGNTGRIGEHCHSCTHT